MLLFHIQVRNVLILHRNAVAVSFLFCHSLSRCPPSAAAGQASHRRAARWPRSERVHSRTSCANSFPGRAAAQRWASGRCWCRGWPCRCESRTRPGGGTPAECSASAGLRSSPTPDRGRAVRGLGHRNTIVKTRCFILKWSHKIYRRGSVTWLSSEPGKEE